MPNLHHYIGANDNSPAWIMEARKRPTTSNPFGRAKKARGKTSQARAHNPAQLAALFPVLAFCTIAALIGLGVATETLTSTVGLLAGCGLLWAVYCGRLQAWRSREMTLLAVIISAIIAVISLAKLGGVALNSVDLAVMTGWIGLGVGWIYKSRTSLITSILATATWLFAAIPALNAFFGLGDASSAGWVTSLPFLVLGQILLSSKLRSGVCLSLALLLAYGWAIWLGFLSAYPLTALAGIGFAIGVAHHRIGKSLSDDQRFGAGWHSLIGAIAALIAAHLIQSVWLDPTMNSAVPGWMPTQTWWVILALASAALFIGSMMRFKHSRITLSGIFILSLATSILPFASIRPDLVRETFAAIPGLTAAPGFGLVIGAAIMAAGLAWVANGLRRLKLLSVVIGAALVGIQMVVLLSPGRATFDLGIVFVCSLIAALCIGGLVAGAALDHARPAQRRT